MHPVHHNFTLSAPARFNYFVQTIFFPSAPTYSPGHVSLTQLYFARPNHFFSHAQNIISRESEPSDSLAIIILNVTLTCANILRAKPWRQPRVHKSLVDSSKTQNSSCPHPTLKFFYTLRPLARFYRACPPALLQRFLCQPTRYCCGHLSYLACAFLSQSNM